MHSASSPLLGPHAALPAPYIALTPLLLRRARRHKGDDHAAFKCERSCLVGCDKFFDQVSDNRARGGAWPGGRIPFSDASASVLPTLAPQIYED